jgi:anti-sigma-K factor RskA
MRRAPVGGARFTSDAGSGHTAGVAAAISKTGASSARRAGAGPWGGLDNWRVASAISSAMAAYLGGRQEEWEEAMSPSACSIFTAT